MSKTIKAQFSGTIEVDLASLLPLLKEIAPSPIDPPSEKEPIATIHRPQFTPIQFMTDSEAPIQLQVGNPDGKGPITLSTHSLPKLLHGYEGQIHVQNITVTFGSKPTHISVYNALDICTSHEQASTLSPREAWTHIRYKLPSILKEVKDRLVNHGSGLTWLDCPPSKESIII